MGSDARFHPFLPTLVVGFVLAGGAAFAADKTPAKPAPGPSAGADARWDAASPLQPAAILGDSTGFVGESDPVQGRVRQHHSLDIEGGTLFSATGQGIAVYDIRTGPRTGYSSYLYGYKTGGHFPHWEHLGDSDWYVKHVDAPAGNKSLAALTLDVQGFAIINAANPSGAFVAYQSKTKTNQVYAVRIGSTDWAYALGDAGKAVRFNMTAAAGMNKCLDLPIGTCPGVDKGFITSMGTESWATLHGTGNFLATGYPGKTGKIKIWSLADPGAPSPVLQINAAARGLAMWQSGGSYYLARMDTSGTRLAIHNVSCISGGACSSAPEVWSTTLAAPIALSFVTASQDAGKSYLYVGGDDLGSCAPQREYIFDVTSPGSPAEMTPTKHPAGYWGWYYYDCETGFNLVGPRIGQVYGGHLYRAAYSILDAHKLSQAGPPVANFTWSPETDIYPGTPVQFTDLSSGGPDSWTWTFPGGSPPAANTQNPVVTFSTEGEKSISLAVSSSTNGPGAAVPPRMLTVLDPTPRLGGITVSPASPIVCQPVTITAVGPGGKPALSYQWKVEDGSGTPVFTQTNTQTSQVWSTATPPVSAGSYTARLTLSNSAGSVVRTAPFTLTAPAPLPLGGQFLPAVDPFSAGTVKLHVVAPGATEWNWDFDGDNVFHEADWSNDPVNGPNPTHNYATKGVRQVRVKVRNCLNPAGVISAAVTVIINGDPGPDPEPGPENGSLKADFSYSPAAPAAGQAVAFNAAASTGNPTGWAWDFGDGSPFGTGAQAGHAYAQPGNYRVQLSVTKPGNCPPAPFCEASVTKTVIVGTVEPPLGASFSTSASCSGQSCTADAGQPVTFMSTSTGSPASVSWSFGDGGSGNGASVSHTFHTAGTFAVTLTIGKGGNTASVSKTFNVSPVVVVPEASTVVLPWVAQSRGVLTQTSSLYVNNPGATPMEIVLEFRRQGQPEANPPRTATTIQPGATIYVGDVLKQLFNVENTVGFVTVTKVKGDRDPVMTSFSNLAGKKGSQFGHTVPSVAVSREGTASATTGSRVQYLVGLNDNTDRQAYFGITNPNAEPAVYRLKFVDNLGRPIGNPSGDLTLPSFGARQYQLSEIRSQFGITAEDDYRVEVETVSGKQLHPYGTNVQTVSKDPSYQGAGQSKERLYLIGAMRTKGSNMSEWQSDIVLSNTGNEVALADVSFLNAGPASQPTAPLQVTLQPGQTERLENVGRSWNVKDAVGLLLIESNSPNGLFPVVQGESYLSTKAKPGSRYGLSMAAFTDEDAAEAGQSHYLVGLRHDANNRTTIWVYNNGNEAGSYDLIYRGLDGKVLGRIDNVAVAAGKLRQLSPSQHPLKAIGGKKGGGVPGGFTLEVVVKSGKVLAAAQVVNNKTNDPSYIRGQAQ